MKRPPLAHRVIIPRPYVPAIWTDIRRTIAAEKKRLAALKPKRKGRTQ